MKRKITAAGLIGLLILCFLNPCVSAQDYETAYVINNGKKVPMPAAYTFSYSIDAAVLPDGSLYGYFDQPSDLKSDKDGFLYVADTKNNRVLRLTSEGIVNKVYDSADNLEFKEPQGVFPAYDGTLFIADTGNERIVRLTSDGKTVSVLPRPQADELSSLSVYSPTKIAFSEYGELYVLMGENIMTLDENNNFRGYIGQTKIGYSFVEALLRKVASDIQKRSIKRRTASAYDNFCLSDDGLIYAVNRDTSEGQLKVINSVGNNIYRKVSSVSDSGITLSGYISKFFTGNVIRKSFSYGEKIDGNDPLFAGICVDKNGIVSAVEKQSGRIYQYDQSGNLLAVFGGLGDKNGEFTVPGSMCCDKNGNIYILDTSRGGITVYSPTKFIITVQNAVTAYYNGEYDTAKALYDEVLQMDSTYPLAFEGLAAAAYKEGRLNDALAYYKSAGDRVGYSNVFTEYRYGILKSHFVWIFLAAVLIIAIVAAALVTAAKKSKKVLLAVEYDSAPIDFKNGILLAVSMIFRPGRTIEAIHTSRKRLKIGSAWLIIALLFVTRIIFIYTVHFPLQDIELSDVNLALEFFKLIVPVLTWAVASSLITSQMDGESTLSECFVCTVYSMAPYIVVNLLATALSHILSQNETGFFALMVNGVTVWCVLLIIATVHRINDYSGMRTFFVCIITLIAVVLIWFTVLFGYSLVVRLFRFFGEVSGEVELLLW